MSDGTHNPRRDDHRLLIEQVTSAWRPRDRTGRIDGHPAWYDLPEDQRLQAYEATVAMRRLEAALDWRGLSSTGRVVMSRIMDAL